MPQRRTVFFISDGTGITAEMLGHSLLTQFEGVQFNQVTLPFVDSVARAEECLDHIEREAVRAARGCGEQRDADGQQEEDAEADGQILPACTCDGGVE